MARSHSPISGARGFGQFALGSICSIALTLACGTEDEERSFDDDTDQATLANRAPAVAVTPTRSPAPPAVSVRAPSAANAPAPPASNAGGAPGNAAEPEPEAAAQPTRLFAACTYAGGSYGSSCDRVFVTMKQMSPPQCVQLTLDDCAEYGNRSGLSVRMPMPWGLDSGTVSSNLNECELGVFYPSSSVAQRASGSVRWNETTRLPSEIALDVTLETSSVNDDNALVELVTLVAIAPTVCDE